MQIEALIERLEGLSGPDREVDAEIDAALFGGRASHTFLEDCGGARLRKSYGAGTVFLNPDPNDNGGHVLLTHHRKAGDYTASLDAAIALAEKVLPGYGLSIENHPVYGDWWDAAVFDQLPKTVSNARKQTPALAACLALFRALAAGGSDA